MKQELNIARLVRCTVNLAPMAAARRGFGTLLIVGDSDVIPIAERLRAYTDLESVAQDFGMDAPEYKAAALYFGQTPRPQQLMVGRWDSLETGAELQGGIISDPDAALQDLKANPPDVLALTINGGFVQTSDFSFANCTNMNAVAAEMQGSLVAYGANVSVTWTGQRFVVKTQATGENATISYFEDSRGLLLDEGQALPPTQGKSAENPAEIVRELADMSGQWYGCSFAATTMPTDNQLVEVAQFIEGTGITRIFGITETNPRVFEAAFEGDLASRCKQLGFRRTCVQYSENPHAVCSMFGRAFSVDFNANRSVITLMFKQEPGVAPQGLSESQAQTLRAKRCNVYAQYNNDTAILQYGVMSGNAYFDEVHGLDWLSDALQNALYNLLYQSKTKIPQTDAGQNQLVNCCAAVCDEAIHNGLVAPGKWNADGFGQITRGDYLTEGFYIYSPPIAEQAQATREQRIAPPIQIAVKLAGAIHEIDCIVDVNR